MQSSLSVVSVALFSLARLSAPMATVSFLKPAKPGKVLQGREVANDPYKLFYTSQKVKRAKMCIELHPLKACVIISSSLGVIAEWFQDMLSDYQQAKQGISRC